ncbi:MAG: Arginine deiminase [Flavobacteriaceae bacterium]|nr:MAG: Arginine deiminase [Flavobacteriaceae bacterium]
MLQLNITNEFSRLRAVVLGTAQSNGPTPTIEQSYDPKSAEHIQAGTYPTIEDMILEMEGLAKVFEKYQVKVYRPTQIENYNQIFSRDIGFVVENLFINANILSNRAREIQALQYVIDQIHPQKVITLPQEVHIEGGDVMPHGDYIFVGTYYGDDYSSYITARTNLAAVTALQELFPEKIVKPFNLKKSNTEAHDNALHLDCCFQPIGHGRCIIHKDGFLIQEEYQWLVDFFGPDNCFNIDKDEMYNMNSNIFSISEDVIISEKNFTRLNSWLLEKGYTVEEVEYAEIAKQEGLLRCSTMPLFRD